MAIWAWVHSKYVFKPEDRVAYFKRAKSLGIVGLKIDFMDPANHVWVHEGIHLENDVTLAVLFVLLDLALDQGFQALA